MNDKELTRSLGNCLDQLAAGEAIAACLAQHPEQAAELAPLLAMAVELGSLRGYGLSEAARRRAHARLLRAEVDRNSRDVTHGWRFGSLAVSRLAAGLALVFACVVLTTGMVAASQPGDLAYPVRTFVERAPVLLQATAEAKATVELRIADRRLADLETHLATKGEIAPAAIEALLAGDRAAAGRADELTQTERLLAASRVAAHAVALTNLARSAQQPLAEATLQAAAVEAESLAQHLERGSESEDTPSPTDAGPTEPPAAPAIGVPPASVTPIPESQAPEASTSAPLPTSGQPTRRNEMLSATPVPGRRATALAQTATAPIPTDTPQPSPVNTATNGPDTPVPGRRATALAQTATAPATVATDTPQPAPVNTSTSRPDTPVPGRRATALAQTATAPAPAATDTPEPSPVHTPAGGPDTPVPGRRATVLAQTATPAAAKSAGSSAVGTPLAP